MTADRPEQPPVAYVEWVDAAVVADRWEDRDTTLAEAGRITATAMRSAGLLLELADDYIVLGLSLNPNRDDVNLAMVIPRSAIRKLELWAPTVPAAETGAHG